MTVAAGNPEPLLELEHVSVSYPIPRSPAELLRRAPRRTVCGVAGVSLRVHAGEMLALVGESGCGKTTTALASLLLTERSEGSVRFEGREISRLPERAVRRLRRRMQIVYQDPYEALDPRFRVIEALEEPLRVNGMAGGGRAARIERASEALRRVGLSPPELFLDRYPHELSGGQRQRIAIAASLVLEPRLLIADEPVSMLDVSARAGVLALLDDLRRSGLGILMITHDLSTAVHYADRIAVMYLGRVVEEGPARAVVREPRHPYTRALLSVVPRRDPRHQPEPIMLRGEAPDAAALPPGCAVHPRCPVAVDACAVVRPELLPAADRGPATHRAACLLLDDAPEPPRSGY